MTRTSFKMLREWVRDWNEGHKEVGTLEVSAWSGYYRINIVDEVTGAVKQELVAEETPGRAWTVFHTWTNGYFTCQRLFEEGKLVVLSAKNR